MVGSTPAVEAYCELCVAVFSSGRAVVTPLLANLVGILAEAFSATGGCPACLEAIGKAIETFGAAPEAAASFQELLDRVAALTIAAVKADLDANPDLVGKFFDMLMKTVLICPEIVLNLQSLASGELVEMAAGCLGISQQVTPAPRVPAARCPT
jgi:hypothetical protein